MLPCAVKLRAPALQTVCPLFLPPLLLLYFVRMRYRCRVLLKVELVQTACYGVRVYTNTSWLANHVDTKATHAVSVIMQVDQVSHKRTTPYILVRETSSQADRGVE